MIRLIIFGGLPGSGKSSIARGLANETEFQRTIPSKDPSSAALRTAASEESPSPEPGRIPDYKMGASGDVKLQRLT